MGTDAEASAVPVQDKDNRYSNDESLLRRVLRAGLVEERGIQPLPVEERTSTRFFNIFTIWFSMNTNILGVTFGMLGPMAYNLSLRDSSLVVLFFCLLSTLAPAYLSILGPKTGMRQMIQARYSFGRYLVSIPVLLNLATLTGFVVIICITGGQCLSAISNGSVNPNAGIIIIAVLSLLVSFCGFRVLHVYETYAFIPAIISLAIATGCAGSALKNQSVPDAPATAANVLNFGMIVASYQIPWAAMASDLTTYFDPKVPSWRVFAYTYWGLLTPTVLLMTLGAAIAGAIPNNPEWEEAFNNYLVGGALAAMLSSAGGFGNFVVVVLSLTLLGNACGSFYAITLNFQTLVPWLFKVPRYVFAIVISAIVVAVSITAVNDFFLNLENFVSLIGYWSASFVGIVATEHIVFRRQDYSSYDHAIWGTASKLPPGVAALSSGILCFGLVIPCMDQVWYQGPIAKTTGDIGFETALVVSSLVYVPLRSALNAYKSPDDCLSPFPSLIHPKGYLSLGNRTVSSPRYRSEHRLSDAERRPTLSSWTPNNPPPPPPLCNTPWVSTGRSYERSPTLLGDPSWWPLSDVASPSFWPGIGTFEPAPHPSLDPPEAIIGLEGGGDMALLGMLGPMMSSGIDPNDHFFTENHDHLFDIGIHQGVPYQQDRITLSSVTTTPETTANTTFFPVSASVVAAESVPTGTITTTTTETTATQQQPRQGSPASTQSSGSKRKTTHSTDTDEMEPNDDEQVAIKRQRNTLAARKYRQKRLDRIADLERALAEMTGERDDLKLKLVRREAEVEGLREMLGRK